MGNGDRRALAADPGAPGETLASLAADPDLQPIIAANPAAYPQLLDWLGQYGTAEARQAVAARRSAGPPAPVVERRFTEPARTAPLSWGGYELRYVLALAGFVLGGVILVAHPAISWLVGGAMILPALGGTLLAVAAVAVAPATPGSRRRAFLLSGTNAVLATVALVLDIALVGTDSSHLRAVGGFVLVLLLGLMTGVLLASWLALRGRPPATYWLVLPVVVSGAAAGLFAPLAVLTPALTIGAAWVARAVDAVRRTRLTAEERRRLVTEQQHAARVAEIQRWEAAYASAHDGARPPHGMLPPVATVAIDPYGAAPGVSPKSFTTAWVLSLLFGGIAVDRFYLGRPGLAVAKLLVNWLTLGIRAFVDFLVIVTKHARDGEGLRVTHG